MKISELWLHDWIKPDISRQELCERMTMAGLEIESAEPVATPFTNVVVGQVISAKKHPEADRLNLCEVDVGTGKPLSIVCGAKNVVPGIKIPVALEGAELPHNLKITTSTIRGITSHGMLCSARELGLAEESDGLLLLPNNAPLGESIWEYLKLADVIIDVSITPNRGDCLSMLGIAKEISALTQTKLKTIEFPTVTPTHNDILPVFIQAPESCPHYVGRIIRNVRADAETPIWMQERLRRAGVRCISPIVDVMNYVMFELGQPMHAFDLGCITQKIVVRTAKKGEELQLLDGQTISLTPETLVIADNEKPLAIAGVMGGLYSAVTLLTRDVFLESAYFNPSVIARTARQYKLGSESSYRFERGIDPTLQAKAIERATQLILQIAGGEPGPVIDMTEEAHLPQLATIKLRAARIEKMLGMTISQQEVEQILTSLEFICKKTSDGWEVIPPARRSDISMEVDLIEEIMRLYGSDRVPLRYAVSSMYMVPQEEDKLNLPMIRNVLRDLGYHEIISYTFVDKKLQEMLNPGSEPKPLLNPMTSDMTVMRTNLWPGLVKTLIYNLNRQHNRVRLYETGLRFVPQGAAYLQERVLSGLVTGSALPEQWDSALRPVDFFDLKGDLQNVFKLTLDANDFVFKPSSYPALHPGQTADIYRNNEKMGVIGALHPSIIQALDIAKNTFVFEISLDKLEPARLPHYSEVSKFPEIRRDIAIFVDRSVPIQSIQDTIIGIAGELLKEVNLFDVYEGKNVSENRKSLALSLTLQHSSRTLVDEEVADLMERIIGELKKSFAAELRG